MTTAPKRRPGRPRKAGEPTPTPGLTAEGYLAAVVAGTLPADPSRVRAAATLIRYQSTLQRAPLPAPPPKAMQAKAEIQAARDSHAEFEAKAAEIRKRHSNKRKDT